MKNHPFINPRNHSDGRKEKGLVSSSGNVSNSITKKIKSKYMNSMRRNHTRKIKGGAANMNGKTFYIGVDIKQGDKQNLSFQLKNCILPAYSASEDDTNRTFEILYGGGASTIDFEKQCLPMGSNMNCRGFYEKLVDNIKTLPNLDTGTTGIRDADAVKGKLTDVRDEQNLKRFLKT
jgi:hypothetical protein